MKKIIIYILAFTFAVIMLPSVIVKVGGGVKKLALEDFKKSYNVGQTTVRVYITEENKTVDMNVEEYVRGVVAAELPKYFDIEAMKAQAVAARTYALARKEGLYRTQDHGHGLDGADADVCTDVHCQVWVSKEKAFERWGSDAEGIWSKVDMAVTQTSGLVITYEGKMINPLYHSNSGGMTENVSAVWKTEDVPYLTSVASPGEDAYDKEFNGSITISYSEFIKKLKALYKNLIISDKDPLKDIKIGLRSPSDRVNDIKIGNITMKGTDFRSLFGLKSTNFTIGKTQTNSLIITTIGNGHGVGMSQCGANAMAESGKNYTEILANYYQGTAIVDYKTIKNNY
jgi:stage II sporulation protein D